MPAFIEQNWRYILLKMPIHMNFATYIFLILIRGKNSLLKMDSFGFLHADINRDAVKLISMDG